MQQLVAVLAELSKAFGANLKPITLLCRMASKEQQVEKKPESKESKPESKDFVELVEPKPDRCFPTMKELQFQVFFMILEHF
jgi:hypothetical protein